MPVSKKRKNIKHKRRQFTTTKHNVENPQDTRFEEVHLKYLPMIDTFQVRLKCYIQNKPIRILGNIDPDKSYEQGIFIQSKNVQRWMTVSEIYLSRKNYPLIFASILGYVHMVGDLLDLGALLEHIPEGHIEKPNSTFKDEESIELYQNQGGAKIMQCPKCNSTNIGKSMKYAGTFIITQFGEQISDNLTPIPSGQYWRCMDCNAKVERIVEDYE